MMKALCEAVDKESRVAYLEASPESISLYRKFGFQEVDRIEVDIQSKPYVNLCMIKKPQLTTDR